MADKSKFFFDVWLVHGNSVYRAVPYEVVTDWIQQGRVLEDDKIRPAGSEKWFALAEVPAFSAFIPKPDMLRTDEQSEALQPLETAFSWSHKGEEGDQDVDMIPLIDVSLVLLIFFMLTSAVAVSSRIKVPQAEGLVQLGDEKVKRIWIGINYLGPDQPPSYSISVNSDEAKEGSGSSGLNKEETLRRVDEIITAQAPVPEIRVAAHRKLSFDLVKDLAVALEKYKADGKVHNIRTEIGDKK
jgi:biopolymer transport protein ExbD